jgi:hypothetical protein
MAASSSKHLPPPRVPVPVEFVRNLPLDNHYADVNTNPKRQRGTPSLALSLALRVSVGA